MNLCITSSDERGSKVPIIECLYQIPIEEWINYFIDKCEYSEKLYIKLIFCVKLVLLYHVIILKF